MSGAPVTIAIVGIDGTKMSEGIERDARQRIAYILKMALMFFAGRKLKVISGESPLGGVDLIAIEVAKDLGMETQEYPPEHNHWPKKGECAHGDTCYGFKARNDVMARDCDILYCITCKDPESYCHFCDAWGHVKTGGCYTLQVAAQLAKQTSRVDL